MRIRISTLRRAFFGLYRELATADGDVVSVIELKDAWQATGLRHGDLLVVMQDLVRARMLLTIDRAQDPLVCLLPAGLHAFHQADAGIRHAIEDRVALARLRWRRLRRALSWQRRERRRRRDDEAPSRPR
jgi:hypothetical protein